MRRAVPKARDWLCGEETKTNHKPKLRSRNSAWVWDWIDGEWTEATRASLVARGASSCVAAACGGYRTDRGFDPESRDRPVISQPAIPDEVQSPGRSRRSAGWREPEFQRLEDDCLPRFGSGGAQALKIADEVRLPDEMRGTLSLAARWHDWGKSHPAFQGAIPCPNRPPRSDLAKATRQRWLDPRERIVFRITATHGPHSGTNWRAPWPCSHSWRRLPPKPTALFGPWSEAFAKIGPRYGLARSHQSRRTHDPSESLIARPRRSTS